MCAVSTVPSPTKRIEFISISFVEDQIIYAEGGALILCLSTTTTLDRPLNGSTTDYEVLGLNDAAFVVECFEMECNASENFCYRQMIAAG